MWIINREAMKENLKSKYIRKCILGHNSLMALHEHGISITFSLGDPVLKITNKTRFTNRKSPPVFWHKRLFIIMISMYSINYLQSRLSDS